MIRLLKDAKDIKISVIEVVQARYLLSKYLEGHTKSILLIRGTYVLSVLVDIVYMS